MIVKVNFDYVLMVLYGCLHFCQAANPQKTVRFEVKRII